MSDTAIATGVMLEQEPEIMYATIDITYDNEVVLKKNNENQGKQLSNYGPIEIVENCLPILAQKLSERLTGALQTEISVRVLEVRDGSVIVKIGVFIRNATFAIILGMIVNLATDEVRAYLANPPPNMENEIVKYNERCETTRQISEETLTEFDQNHLKSREYKVETKTIESICISESNKG